MKKSIIGRVNYRISWMARLLATHTDFASFTFTDNSVQLDDRASKKIKEIPYLLVGSGIALKKGYIWDRLSIHLENGEIIHIGGIRKKHSTRLQLEFNQACRLFIKNVYQNLAPQIQDAAQQAKILFSGQRYIRRRVAQQWLHTHEGLAYVVKRQDRYYFLSKHLRQQLKIIEPFLIKSDEAIEAVNTAYIDAQLRTFKHFFDHVETHPLTPNQRLACVIDEQHNRVLAGAGTGKTSTMIGRAGYLLKAGLAKPEQILMLAFARKAAEEMEDRIKHKLGMDTLTVKTFHGLGKQIMTHVEGRVPAISPLAEDEHLRARFVDEQLQHLLQDQCYKSRLITYFVRFCYPYKSAFQFKSLGEYNRYILENDIRTLQGELVKSYEECEIANFLYQQGIAYQYEANYQVDTSGPDYRVYQPDFYLPDYGIYIEHFAINERNQTPPFIDQEKYLQGMAWKRELHQKYKTCLIETYSYQKQQGILTQVLAQKLKDAGVQFQPLPDNELLDTLNQFGQVSLFAQLLAQLLTLFKAACQSIKGMVSLAKQHEDLERMQAAVFLFEPIYEAYQQHLKETETIDFDDMIGKAIEYVEADNYRSPYRYILVDEFQDISASRARLIKALLNQNPDNSLFCVGDDWQSIYRFTGSDVTLTQDFKQHFGETVTTILDRTFRFNNKISDLASRFIMQNPAQIAKKINSHRHIDHAAVSLIKTPYDPIGLNAVLNAINHQVEMNVSVLILARFHFRKPKLTELRRDFPKLNIQFMTVHAAKGKEADYVVILGLEKGKHGFPSEKAPHPILELLLPPPEPYANAEERRLFYVALTRARHHVYLISDANKTSDFVRELLKNNYEIKHEDFSGEGFQEKIADISCPVCKTGYMVPRNSTHGQFYGCNQYPLCTHTEPACPWCGGGLKPHGRFKICESTGCDYVQPACPKCGGNMYLRKGRYGQFWGCSHYRKNAENSCTHTEQFIQHLNVKSRH